MLMAPGLFYSLTCFKTKDKLSQAEKMHRNINEDDVASILELQLDKNSLRNNEISRHRVFQSLLDKPAPFEGKKVADRKSYLY